MPGYSSKRALDIVLGLLLLAATSPLFIVAFFLVLFDGNTPFFTQRRLGLNCKEFTIYKFKTMKSPPRSSAAPLHIQPDAPQLTSIGRFLRNTSMDELPQLFNVLKGDMSLIGPRPHAIEYAKHYASFDPRYYERYQALPGIVCLVQITSLRYLTETPDHIRTRISADLYYIKHASLWLDIKILYKTFFCVILPRFSYKKSEDLLDYDIAPSSHVPSQTPREAISS